MPHGTSDRMTSHPSSRCIDGTVRQSAEFRGALGRDVGMGAFPAGILNDRINMKSFNLCKLGYAFIPNAVPSGLMSDSTYARANRMAKRNGGLMVGGFIELSPAGVSFKPHAREEPLHVGLQPINILASNIRSVTSYRLS